MRHPFRFEVQRLSAFPVVEIAVQEQHAKSIQRRSLFSKLPTAWLAFLCFLVLLIAAWVVVTVEIELALPKVVTNGASPLAATVRQGTPEDAPHFSCGVFVAGTVGLVNSPTGHGPLLAALGLIPATNFLLDIQGEWEVEKLEGSADVSQFRELDREVGAGTFKLVFIFKTHGWSLDCRMHALNLQGSWASGEYRVGIGNQRNTLDLLFAAPDRQETLGIFRMTDDKMELRLKRDARPSSFFETRAGTQASMLLRKRKLIH